MAPSCSPSMDDHIRCANHDTRGGGNTERVFEEGERLGGAECQCPEDSHWEGLLLHLSWHNRDGLSFFVGTLCNRDTTGTFTVSEY